MTIQHAETQEGAVMRLLEAGPKRAFEIIENGGSRTAISRLAAAGEIEAIGKGVYRRADAEYDARATWAAIAQRVPSAVFCLTSAAAFHGITQDSAWRISIALPHRQGTTPRLPGSELEVSRWRSEQAFSIGIDEHVVGGVVVRVTSPARTVVDLFRASTLNPRARAAAAKITPETFLDALFRYLDPARGLDDTGELARIADAFGVLDYIAPCIQTAQFAGARMG